MVQALLKLKKPNPPKPTQKQSKHIAFEVFTCFVTNNTNGG